MKAKWFADAESFRELSMGMSHDYHDTIAAGSTFDTCRKQDFWRKKLLTIKIIIMATLETTFAGLKLRNPIIVSSSD